MNILVAVDEHPYSSYAIGEVSRLAGNTWPDVTLLGVAPEISPDENNPMLRMLRNYRRDLLAGMGSTAEIYGTVSDTGEFRLVEKNVLEESASGRKTFRLRLRSDDPAKSILTEAKHASSDLIILGCSQGESDWSNDTTVSGKVAEGAECSVFVVKETKFPAKVTCCLDHAHVSQASLEMINQIVTLYGVDLEIVGVQKHGSLKKDQEQVMGNVLDYYLERNVRALLRLVDDDALESFFSMGARTDLMALWVGPTSPFQRFFPRHRVSELVNSSLSSILLLR
ncbi:universal stress protein [Desulfovibrio inopinatus]|uniref:universal stress protein n=1 Tax=Desulfovibrio inopinatus TaxID=102109 RepID=UPI000424EA12|nr:universal stress protein [Desulfovibrio inopinatus]